MEANVIDPTQQSVQQPTPINNMVEDWARTFNLDIKFPKEKDNQSAKPAVEGAAKPAAPAKAADGAAKPAEPAKAADGAAKPAEPAKAAEGATKPGEEEEISDVVDLKGTPAPEKVSFKNVEELNAFIKKEFSIDDAATLLNSAKDWRKGATETGTITSKYNNLAKAIQEAPPILFEALDAYWKGEDYKSHLSKVLNEVDYSLPFEKQNVSLLIKKISPDVNVSDPNADGYLDLTDEKNSAVKALVNSVKTQYLTEQTSLSEKKARITKDQSDKAASFLNSITSSVEAFKTQYPKVDAKYIKVVEEVLASDDVEARLLLDEKGKVRPDAAEGIYFFFNGKAKVQELAKAYVKLQTQYQELLGRGSDKTKLNGKTEEAVQEQKSTNSMVNTFLTEKPSPFREKKGQQN